MTREEAIQILRTQYPHDAVIKEALGLLIPELRESEEDERARKWLVDLVENLGEPADEEAEKELEVMRPLALAYLEKQKEQKPAENGVDVIKTSALLAADRIASAEMTGRLKERSEILENPEEYGLYKSAEWSEEDEKMLQRIIRHTESEYQDWCNDKYGNSEIVSDGKRSCLERLDWLEKRLKSLRPQPHKEIYQAAKRDLAIKFMNYLDENRPEGKMSLSNGECEDIDKAFKEGDWAKIIRYIKKYQPHWKPSEEQMRFLLAVINEPNNAGSESCHLVLKGLYEQLKNL